MAKKTIARLSPETAYKQVDSRYLHVAKRNFKLECCDCGLVHTLNIKVDADSDVHIQFIRDNRSTAAVRRKRGHKRPKP